MTEIERLNNENKKMMDNFEKLKHEFEKLKNSSLNNANE